MEYRELYKARRVPKLTDILTKRKNTATERLEQQRELFWRKRNPAAICNVKKNETTGKAKQSRAEMLVQWKAEKQKKLEEERKKKKPVFKVGIVQKKVTGSPLILDKNFVSRKQKLSANQENHSMTTRSKAKASRDATSGVTHYMNQQREPQKMSFCRIEKDICKPLNSYKFKLPKSVAELGQCRTLTYPDSPQFTNKIRAPEKSCVANKSNHKKGNTISLTNNKKQEISFKERSPGKGGTLINVDSTNCAEKDPSLKPIYYSPFIEEREDVTSRSGHEVEFQTKILLFKNYITCETKRLLDKCNTWKIICDKNMDIPQEILGEIYSVTGKTILLTSDKFRQFKDLIEKCEAKDPLIKLEDLQGFQDWISIEVHRIEIDFNHLEERKKNNWAVEVPKTDENIVKVSRNVRKKVKKPMGKSNIRDHINAVRNGLKALKDNDGHMKSMILTPKRNNTNLKGQLRTPKYSTEKHFGGVDLPEKDINTCIKSVSPNATLTYENALAKSTSDLMTPDNSRVIILRSGSKVRQQCKGLDEKYFRPVLPESDSPFHLVRNSSKVHGSPKLPTRTSSRISNLACVR